MNPAETESVFTELGPGGNETILLCEDDAAVRRFVGQVLTGNGYTVLAAGDSRKALGLISEYESPIDLLLSDMVMPGMSGRELAEQMIEQRPGTKVLLMSGYADEVFPADDLQGDAAEFIEKPFLAEQLLSRIREVLER